MKSLSRLLTPERILWLDVTSKNECLRAMVDNLAQTGSLEGPEDIFRAILEREKLLSTGFGLGLAIPHAKLRTIRDFVVGLGIHKQGVNFDSLDEQPVHVLVMILGPDSQQEDYLKVLSRVTAFLKDNRERLLTLETSQQVYELAYDY
ncbi:MAG TPA: PTS sugar transporter subunit IIA [Planctomycetota bacterium]|jgi:PTS system nitrogen regulatory IIA component|nr:PTS sugar transporter subunit IIA [Planctomycetota bacterium]